MIIKLTFPINVQEPLLKKKQLHKLCKNKKHLKKTKKPPKNIDLSLNSGKLKTREMFNRCNKMKSISESLMNFCKNIIFGAKINDGIYDFGIQIFFLNLTIIYQTSANR